MVIFLLQNPFRKFFGRCNRPYDQMLACLKQERLAKRALNAKNAKERHELIRERMKNDKTDYDQLLKEYQKEYGRKSSK